MNDPAKSAPAANAFRRAYLDRLDERDEPASAAEADFAGPWKVEEVPGRGFAVLREWESATQGQPPDALCEEYELALKLAAVLPAAGREPLFWAGEAAGGAGFALQAAGGERGVRQAGTLRHYNATLLVALHVAECLVRSPVALAALLEAAGPLVQEKVGQILHLKVME